MHGSATAAVFRTTLPRQDIVDALDLSGLDPQARRTHSAVTLSPDGSPLGVDVWAGPMAGAVALARGSQWSDIVPGEGQVWSVTATGPWAPQIASSALRGLHREGQVSGYPFRDALEFGDNTLMALTTDLLTDLQRTSAIPPGTAVAVAHLHREKLYDRLRNGVNAQTAVNNAMKSLGGFGDLCDALIDAGVTGVFGVDYRGLDVPDAARIGLPWRPGAWLVQVMGADATWDVVAYGQAPIPRAQVAELSARVVTATEGLVWSVCPEAAYALQGAMSMTDEPDVPGSVNTAIIATTLPARGVAQEVADAMRSTVEIRGGVFVVENQWGAVAVSPAPQWAGSIPASEALPDLVDMHSRHHHRADLDGNDQPTKVRSTAFGDITAPDTVDAPAELRPATGLADGEHMVAVTTSGAPFPPSMLSSGMFEDDIIHGWPLMRGDVHGGLVTMTSEGITDVLTNPTHHLPPGAVLIVARVTGREKNLHVALGEGLSAVIVEVLRVTATMPGIVLDRKTNSTLHRLLPMPDVWKPGTWTALLWDGAEWRPLAGGPATPQRTDISAIARQLVARMRQYALLAAPANADALGFAVTLLDESAAGPIPAHAEAPDTRHAGEDLHARLLAAQARANRLEKSVADLRSLNTRLARDLEAVREPVDVAPASTADVEQSSATHRTRPVAPRPPEVTTVAEALLAARDLPGLRILDSAVEAAHELDAHTRSQRGWAARTWAQLATMSAMTESRREGTWSGSIAEWVRAGDAGVSAHTFAPTESEWVMSNQRARQERTFDVPGMGPVTAYAHWRIGGGQPPAPRMHVIDAGGYVVIPYAGPHLLNQSTARA